MNKIRNVMLAIYFFLAVPASGIFACMIIENSLFRVIGVIGVAIIHGCITAHFFDVSGKSAAVIMLFCIAFSDFYSIIFL